MWPGVSAKKIEQLVTRQIEATSAENNTIQFADGPPTGVTVQRGHTLDGLGEYYLEMVDESDEQPVDVVQALKDAQVDVLVSYLPVGCG